MQHVAASMYSQEADGVGSGGSNATAEAGAAVAASAAAAGYIAATTSDASPVPNTGKSSSTLVQQIQ